MSPLDSTEQRAMFRVHDALGNWMVEDVRAGRMICMTTRITDAKYIADAQKVIEQARELIRRYRTETPPGYQPHMIADQADRWLIANKEISDK